MRYARLSSRLLLIWCLLQAVAGAGDDEAEEVCQAGAPGCAQQEEDGIAHDIAKMCPLVDTHVTTGVLWLLQQLAKPTRLIAHAKLWPWGIDRDNWCDDYIALSYLLVVRISLGLYWGRDSSWVNIPTEMNDPEDDVAVERIHAPHWDVDGTPNFLWFEGIVPKFLMRSLYAPALTCFQSVLRRLSTDTGKLNGTFEDTLDDPVDNTWGEVLKKSPFGSKRDWVMAFYDIAKAWDGKPLWPPTMTDFRPYWKSDEFDDRLEYAIAFHLIGVHRLETGSWTFNDLPGIESLTLPFRLPLNAFSSFEVRENFGRYGADMYFDQDGLPVLVQTPEGEIIVRGDKQWQYWKFVWRSTLVTGVTLVDHLYFTHFRASNVLARMIRVATPPKNPFRRLMSIFTFGAIFVNLQAMHTLIGPNHMLHRATPFKRFSAIADTVPSAKSGLMKDIVDTPGIKPLFDDQEWANLHPKIKAAPFFADGRLIAHAISNMTDKVWRAAADTFCEPKTGKYTNTFWNMKMEILKETLQAGYSLHKGTYTDDLGCADLSEIVRHRFNAYIFIVTAWHKHVGFVGDYYSDPHLATMSWKDGEPYGRPKQHMIMTIINVFTSTNQPLLKEDFTHLFKGMEPDLEDEFTRFWREFQSDLQTIEEEIDRRNKEREIFNDNFSPRVLESAVSK